MCILKALLIVERYFALFRGQTCVELGKVVSKMSLRLSQFPLASVPFPVTFLCKYGQRQSGLP